MKTLVLGAGAVGGFVGGRLVQAGRDVDFLVRPARAAQLGERGLRITDGAAEEVVEVRAVTAPLPATAYDLVLVGVKGQALAPALRDVAPAVGPQTAVVPFLNGIGHIDALTRAFGTSAVLGGTLKVVTQLESDGAIRQFAPGGVIEVGEFDGAMSPRLAEITETLSVPGFAVSASADIMAAMWAKWVFIATIGAVTSVARGPIGEAAAVEGGVEFAEGVLAEAASVARASGHPLGASGFETIRSTVTAVGAPITSSLSRDLMSGRPTEVEDVLGDLVARARTLGLTVGRLEAATLTLRTHNARVAR